MRWDMTIMNDNNHPAIPYVYYYCVTCNPKKETKRERERERDRERNKNANI